jgi:protease-4|nr:signal peptide peptidase SppA [Kofleriaceae bacterium]
MARFALVACALIAACKANPSALQSTGSGTAATLAPANDPWASTPSSNDQAAPSKSGDDDSGGGSLGGFDLKGALSKIKDSISKPGPYEAPEQSAGFDAMQPHWGVMRVHGAIVERSAFSWTGGRGTELRALTDRLRALGNDDKLLGLVLRLDGLEISLPDAIELRAAMHAFRAKSKRLACHVENAQAGTYLVATACDAIALAPVGEVVLPGPAAMPIHLKGLLDKLGVQADFVHIGDYKSAAEPLTRDTPSPQMIEVLNDILDRRYQTMVDIVASERKLDAATVQGLIDTAMFEPQQAQDKKLVDAVAPFEGFRDQTIGTAAWTRLELDSDKDNPLAAALELARFVGAMPPDRPAMPHVALVYAIGNIVDGDGDGLLGARGEIAGRTLVAALRAIAADDSVKAVVLRVDSGGGSAQASELIWRALQEVSAKKPVFVSMSDVAASGGYYISSGAAKIFALDDTLTGSIGVVGGKIAPAAALAKLGVTTFPMGKGKRATMWSSLGPWSDDERELVRSTMTDVYDVFKSRVAAGRHKSMDDVQKIAQGRVWTGAKAKELGLVDEIGGLDAALDAARTAGKVDATADLEVYPPSVTLRDVLHSFGAVQAPLGLGSELDAIDAADPRLGREARQLVELVASFQHTAIQTVAILPVMQ